MRIQEMAMAMKSSNITIFNLKSDKTLNYKFDYNNTETKAINEKINNNSKINLCDLRQIALWKLNRVLAVSEETLKKLQKLASMDNVLIESPFVKELIQELVKSQGIGFPMASTILKFIKPEVFPIIDVRAYRALTGKKLYSSSYNYSIYIEYSERIKKIALLMDRPLNEIDEQLYCFDKEHNGKI